MVPPESWVKLQLDAALPSPAGRATPGQPQNFTIEAERAFFIDGFRCTAECDADGWNPLRMRSEVKVADFAAALARVRHHRRGAACSKDGEAARPRRDYELDASAALTLEDAGFAAQPPARNYAVTRAPISKSADGQTLGYTWAGIVDNWHQRAFTSFGDGHGVWEKAAARCCRSTRATSANVTQWAAPMPPSRLMPTLLALQPRFDASPDGAGTERRLPGHAEPHRVARPRHRRRLEPGREPAWSGPRSSEGEPIAIATRLRRSRDPRLGRAGHQPRHHRQGQPAEHAGLRHAARHRRAGAGANRLDCQAGQQRLLARHDRQRRRGDRPRDAAARRATTGGSSPSL